MKKVLNSLGLRPVLAGLFFIVAFMLSASSAQAQATMSNNQINTAKGLNWVTEAEAIAILTANVDQIAQDMANYIPGSQAYNNALYHLNYYKNVSSAIEQGAIVPEAVLNNLGSFGTTGATEATSQPAGVSTTLYNDIVPLLTF